MLFCRTRKLSTSFVSMPITALPAALGANPFLDMFDFGLSGHKSQRWQRRIPGSHAYLYRKDRDRDASTKYAWIHRAISAELLNRVVSGVEFSVTTIMHQYRTSRKIDMKRVKIKAFLLEISCESVQSHRFLGFHKSTNLNALGPVFFVMIQS